MKGKTYWDFDVTWDVNEALSVTLGGNNIFDEYPGPPPSFRTCCGEPVHTSTVMGWQGSYYYVRGAFRWN